MKKVFHFLGCVAVTMVALVVAFGAGYFYCDQTKGVKVVKEEKNNDEQIDLKLPKEVERRVVTVDEVEAKLLEIGELSTYAGKYTVTRGKEETREFLEKLPIPGTTNSITITCDGIVKVGYDLNDITVRVNEDKIYISIPEAKLNDNYVIWDSVKCDETNSILNPIEFSQYQEIISEIEKEGLKKVTDNGIYQDAEENLKTLINVFLSEFVDYEVIYM